MSRIGIFLDLDVIYYLLKNKFHGSAILDCEKYMNYFADIGNIETAIAFGFDFACKPDFINNLNAIGYEVRSRKPFKTIDPRKNAKYTIHCQSVDLVTAIVEYLDDLDIIVIGSSSINLTPFIIYLMEEKQKKVIIVSARIPEGLPATQKIEIPESMLREFNKTKKA